MGIRKNPIVGLNSLILTMALMQPCSVLATATFRTQFGSGLSNPQGLTQDSAGNTYVVSSGNNRVQVFGPSPYPVLRTITDGFNGPIGAAISPAGPNAGNLYVTDPGNVRTAVLKTTGTPVSQFNVLTPQGIAIDSTGNSYIADTANNRVDVFNPSNTFTVESAT